MNLRAVWRLYGNRSRRQQHIQSLAAHWQTEEWAHHLNAYFLVQGDDSGTVLMTWPPPSNLTMSTEECTEQTLRRTSNPLHRLPSQTVESAQRTLCIFRPSSAFPTVLLRLAAEHDLQFDRPFARLLSRQNAQPKKMNGASTTIRMSETANRPMGCFSSDVGALTSKGGLGKESYPLAFSFTQTL